MDYRNCTLCPRACGADRTAGERGFCGCPDIAMVAKTMLHRWEEPALAGSGGSGAIFFGGCTLGCSYCQNRAISAAPSGTAMDSAALRREMEALIARGAENIDLVTPTQYLPSLLPALTPKLPVPVVYNCGGYESVQTIHALEGLVAVPLLFRLRFAPYLLMSKQPRALAAMVESVRLTRRNCLRLLKLDLRFWWYYVLQTLAAALCYGDLLLSLLGVALPWSSTAAFLLFYCLGLGAQLALFVYARPRVVTTYALAVQALQPAETPATLPNI